MMTLELVKFLLGEEYQITDDSQYSFMFLADSIKFDVTRTEDCIIQLETNDVYTVAQEDIDFALRIAN